MCFINKGKQGKPSKNQILSTFPYVAVLMFIRLLDSFSYLQALWSNCQRESQFISEKYIFAKVRVSNKSFVQCPEYIIYTAKLFQIM